MTNHPLPGKCQDQARAEVPVFLHAQFRTGSTFLYSRFRANPGLYCYYEPFNEILGSGNKADVENMYAERARSLHHPALDRHYFFEYPFRDDGSLPEFRKEFSYDLFCLDPEVRQEPLHHYLELLIGRAQGRSVFQFCRSCCRIGWLAANFPSLNVYLLRAARGQWESYLSRDRYFSQDRYFTTVSLLIAGKNACHPDFSPLERMVYVPRYEAATVAGEYCFYRALLEDFDLPAQYAVFYYTWLLGLVHALRHCELVVDADLVSADPAAQQRCEGFLARHGLDVSLEGFSIPQYEQTTLAEREMAAVEEQVHLLAGAAWAERLAAVGDRLDQFAGFLSPAVASLLESLCRGRNQGAGADRGAHGHRPADAFVQRVFDARLEAHEEERQNLRKQFQEADRYARSLEQTLAAQQQAWQAEREALTAQFRDADRYAHSLEEVVASQQQAWDGERRGFSEQFEEAARYARSLEQVLQSQQQAWEAERRALIEKSQTAEAAARGVEQLLRLEQQARADERQALLREFEQAERYARSLEQVVESQERAWTNERQSLLHEFEQASRYARSLEQVVQSQQPNP